MKALLKGYAPGDVFNADEFGLFFNTMRNKSLSFKEETFYGGKLSKERLTVLLCASSDGTEKLSPLVISKSAKQRYFENVRCFSCEYSSQRHARMILIVWSGSGKKLFFFKSLKK